MIDEKAPSVIGYNVTVLTKTGESHKGTIWNEDKQAGLIMLQSPATSGTPGLHSVTMLKTSHIADVVSATPPDAPEDTTLPKVDTEKIARREARAVERMERQIKSRGVGVTDQAQRLFDNLCKTMPCKWQSTTIEVFDAVLITAPYTLDTCNFREGAEENTTVMERVQAVLGEELKRLETEESASKLPSGPDAVGAPGTPAAKD